MRYNTLVVGPSNKTRGGVSSVIRAYVESDFWKKWNCIWIETHIDRSLFDKVNYFLRGFLYFMWYLPGCKIVHIHLSEPVSAFRKLSFFLPAFILRKKIIVHFHSFSPDTTVNGRFAWLYKWIFRNSDCVILLSEYWKREVESSFPEETLKIVVLYNPAPSIESVAPVHSEKYLLFAGTLNERKGFKDLIRAFATIAHRYPEWHLYFAGNGNIEEGVTLCKEMSITSQVKFLGWIDGKNKDEAYRNASIFCLPSYAEGFPMSVIDALSYSLPIITTPVGGIPDVFEHKINALIFKQGDIEQLADCIEMLIRDEEIRTNLAHSSYTLSQTKFEKNTLVAELNTIYETVMDIKKEIYDETTTH